ncbi:MAG: hypothetical protein IKA08_04995 [Alphaproteobacteria bacterium]|nr:hypothetical protein [Alphaproteobacteria bacterium]
MIQLQIVQMVRYVKQATAVVVQQQEPLAHNITVPLVAHGVPLMGCVIVPVFLA